MNRADQVAAAALRSNRVLLDAWGKAEDRTLRFSTFVAGLCVVMAMVRPWVGYVCMAIYAVLVVTTIRASRRELKAIKRAMELGHDHD